MSLLSQASHVLPSREAISFAHSKLLSTLPSQGLGVEHVNDHLRNDIVPGLNNPSRSANYYGFVTGGVTAAAALADNVVTETDQNVQVHLPNETVVTDVEDRSLRMVCDLLELSVSKWQHRTFTTGATASNVVGLACAREYILRQAANRAEIREVPSVADHGIYEAMSISGVSGVQILTTVPHSSLRKAASIVGLGRNCVVDVGRKGASHRFDFALLEQRLQRQGVASIVVVSCAEVNTGLFATNGKEMRELRRLCDEYGAWIHVDAAFGLLARILPDDPEYSLLRQGVTGLELADSITGDAHKLLNVPYDCGIFLSRHLDIGTDVFRNTNAAYLIASSETTVSSDRAIPSPLNIGIENSRRFRALPVYATLAAYGRDGYRDMIERQIKLSRGIARLILESDEYELLTQQASIEGGADDDRVDRLRSIYIIVLFRAKDEDLNKQLVQRLNASRKLYVSGTQWDGKPAARFAVANWLVEVGRDLEIIRDVLTEASKQS